MKKKLIYLMTVSAIIIALDQITKLSIHTQFQLHESVSIIPNYFNLTYVRNFGAAFGVLAQAPAAFREIFFLSVPPIACILILFILADLKENQTPRILALSSVFGGAIGNYIDRVQYRYVIDFLDFHFYDKQTWPAFNVADMAIVIGVLFLLYGLMTDHKNSKNSLENDNSLT